MFAAVLERLKCIEVPKTETQDGMRIHGKVGIRLFVVDWVSWKNTTVVLKVGIAAWNLMGGITLTGYQSRVAQHNYP